MKPLVIVNPAAGGGRALRFWRRAAPVCLAAGLELEVFMTRKRGDAADRAADAGDRLVISVGGDGTAHEVVNGLLRRPRSQPPAFGALLAGTGADLVRSVPSPRRPELVATWLSAGRFRRLDAARVATPAGHRYFINAADVGIGAEVVRRAAAGPALVGGTLNFMGAAVASLLGHHNAGVRLRLDDGTVRQLRIRTIAVSNGSCLGGGMRMAPRAKVDDGLLEVVIVGDIGRLRGIRSLPLLYRGTHDRLREVEFATARRVEVESESPIGVEADGELVGTTPAIFEILPGALQVLDFRP